MVDRRKKEETPEGECKHKFIKIPPRIGKLKVCVKCGFLWAPGGMHLGEHTIKLSGSGNYIEANTTAAPTTPATGKYRLYSPSNGALSMIDGTGTTTTIAPVTSTPDIFTYDDEVLTDF